MNKTRTPTFPSDTSMPHTLSRLFSFALTLASLALAASCHYAYPTASGSADTDSLGGIDSARFVMTHHYWRGDVFRTSDSLRLYVTDSPVRLLQQASDADALRTAETVAPDTMVVHAGTRLAVTTIANVPDSTNDSTWVYLTAQGGTAGWSKEGELLAHAAPDDPISRYIHRFSRLHTPLNLYGIAIALVVIAFFAYRRRRIEPVLQLQGSPYPIVLRMCVSLCGLLYAAVWHIAPHTWTEFYFNPTLNPFADGLPPVLSVFLASAWLLGVMTLAVLDDVWRRLPPAKAIEFAAELAARCGMVFILFSLTTEFIYVGYAMLAAYWGILLHRLWRANRGRHYRCGRCGRLMATVPGNCPHCGAYNAPPPVDKREQQGKKQTSLH